MKLLITGICGFVGSRLAVALAERSVHIDALRCLGQPDADHAEFEAVVGKDIVIHFANHEAVPHDVAVYKDNTKKDLLGKSDIVTGPNGSSTLTIPAQAPGQLYFECTIHNSMNGSLVVLGGQPAS